MDEKRKKHCWECLRRRLVCDSTRSGCKRCSASGVPCPGYGETKPSRLKWLAPGRVTSQNRRAKDTVPYGLQDDNIDSLADVDSLIMVPRFKMRTEQCDLAQAIGYCKFCELYATDDVTHSNTQTTLAYIKTFFPCRHWGQIHTYTLSLLTSFTVAPRIQTMYGSCSCVSRSATAQTG